MTTPFNEPSQSDPQAAQPQQSLRQQAVGAWNASGQTGVLSAAKFGYQFGKQAQQSAPTQSGTTHWGDVQDGYSHGTTDGGWSGGNDAGPELATSEDVAGLHAKLDEMHQSIGGMQSGGQGGGGQGNLNQQQFAPAQPREAPPSPLAVSAQQRSAAMDRMAQSQQHLASTRANSTAMFQQRQASFSGVQSTGTGNGMGATTANASMSGALPGSPMRPNSGIGQSQSSFDSTRFMGGKHSEIVWLRAARPASTRHDAMRITGLPNTYHGSAAVMGEPFQLDAISRRTPKLAQRGNRRRRVIAAVCAGCGAECWVRADAPNARFCSQSCASKAIPHPFGPESRHWSGDNPSNHALHDRLDAERGKADRCIVFQCDTSCTKFEWANISHEYKDTGDFMPMCKVHHAQHDAETRARGERVAIAKLKPADVLEIRARYTGRYGQQTALANEYRVSPATVASIVRGKTWAWLESEVA